MTLALLSPPRVADAVIIFFRCAITLYLFIDYGRPIGQAIIFCSCGFFLLSSFFFFLLFSSPILSGRRLDVYHTSTRGVALVRIRKSEMCCMWLAEIQDAKIMQKIAIYALSHNFVGLYLRNSDVYRLSEKLVKQQYLIHISNMVNFDRPTNG